MSEPLSLPFDLQRGSKQDSTLDSKFSSKEGLSLPKPAPSRRFRSSRFSRISDPVAAQNRSPLLNGGNLALLPGLVAIGFFGFTHLKELGRLFAPGRGGLTPDPGPAVDLPSWMPMALTIAAALGLSLVAFVLLRRRAHRKHVSTGPATEAPAAAAPVAAPQRAQPATRRKPFGPVLRFSGRQKTAERAEEKTVLAQAEVAPEPVPVDPFSSGAPRRMPYESAQTLPADVQFRRDLRRQLDRQQGDGRTILSPAVKAAMQAHLPPAQPRLVTDSHR